MTTINKIMLTIGLGIIILLSVWIIGLRHQLNKVDKAKEKYWKDKFESAQDSVNIIRLERDKLANERTYLESKRDYWLGQYKTLDSLLNRIKTQKDEKLDIIRNASATERNKLLSDKLSEIRNHRE